MSAARELVGTGLLMAAAWGMMPQACAASEEPATQVPDIRYDAKGRRDPFVSLVRDGRVVLGQAGLVAGGPTDLLLLGIVWDPGGQSIALINDLEVKVGDTVGGYEVIEIRQDRVVLTAGAQEVVLQLMFDAAPAPKPSPSATKGR
jgi:hypothetical protein